jgi:hypothetical protein
MGGVIMKKVIMYVALFFGICFIIGSYSKSLNEKIVFKYARSMVKEIQGKVNNNETLYLNGKILVAYVIGANEKDLTLGINKVTLQDIASSISDHHVYKLERTNSALNIVNVANVFESSIDAVVNVESAIKIKNLVMNVSTLLMGIAFYSIYTKSRKKRLTSMIKILVN